MFISLLVPCCTLDHLFFSSVAAAKPAVKEIPSFVALFCFCSCVDCLAYLNITAVEAWTAPLGKGPRFTGTRQPPSSHLSYILHIPTCATTPTTTPDCIIPPRTLHPRTAHASPLPPHIPPVGPCGSRSAHRNLRGLPSRHAHAAPVWPPHIHHRDGEQPCSVASSPPYHGYPA